MAAGLAFSQSESVHCLIIMAEKNLTQCISLKIAVQKRDEAPETWFWKTLRGRFFSFSVCMGLMAKRGGSF